MGENHPSVGIDELDESWVRSLLRKLAAKNCEDEGGCSKYQNLGLKCSNFGSSKMENLSLDVVLETLVAVWKEQKPCTNDYTCVVLNLFF